MILARDKDVPSPKWDTDKEVYDMRLKLTRYFESQYPDRVVRLSDSFLATYTLLDRDFKGKKVLDLGCSCFSS